MKVEVTDQVVTFVRALPPEPRRRIRLALRHLAGERGDIRVLEGPLSGYSRLRVGPYRLIFARVAEVGKSACILCLFAERRDTVYAVFSDMLKRSLLKNE